MTATRLSRLSIETPEGVVFSFELATPVTRALAWSVDTAAIILCNMMVGKLAGLIAKMNSDIGSAVSVIGFFVISVVYAILLEWRWRGQTVGKRLFGLRVMHVDGLRLQLPQVALRNLLRVIDMLPLFYLVGAVTCLFSRNAQRLGDLAANTIVARERKMQPPDIEQVAPAKYNSLLGQPHLAARLRMLVTPESAALAVRALTLRDHYDPPARIALFRELANYFRSLVEFPDEAVENLTDEQYVRCVVRVIYGAR
jgi:uncharacterized RDD family membrane protein YckC